MGKMIYAILSLLTNHICRCIEILVEIKLLSCEHNAMQERPELKSTVNKHGNQKI